MPRIPYGEQPSPGDAVSANVTRMLAVASQPVFRGMGDLGSAFIRGSALPPKLRELAILRVGYISRAIYETWQHEALGRFVGLSDEQIAAIKAGDGNAPALDAGQRAVLAFVDDVVINVRASDATLAAVRQHLDDAQVVDLILVTGYYMTISRLLETTGVELDAEPIDWNQLMQPQ
ncbi:MAG: carboxymuconolactone decarboxylase family protein [Novosphingobium sp.]